jgi:hypothetical protein
MVERASPPVSATRQPRRTALRQRPVLRVAELTNDQRRLVQALLAAAQTAPGGTPNQLTGERPS